VKDGLFTQNHTKVVSPAASWGERKQIFIYGNEFNPVLFVARGSLWSPVPQTVHLLRALTKQTARAEIGAVTAESQN